MSVSGFAYSTLMYALTPLFIGRTVWRSRKQPAQRERLKERLGFVPPGTTQKPCIWLHAVSVGETMAARPLIEQILKRYPDHDLWITTTTLTGSQTVQRLWGERVLHSYLPYDLPDAVARFLARVQPKLVLIMETELWPNLYHACAKLNIPVMLINARLSERSFKGYQKVAGLVRETLQTVTLIAARSAQDAEYFQALGAAATQVKVAGNIKFDLNVPDTLKAEGQVLRASWGVDRPVWVAASTHAGEDEMVLQVFTALKAQYPHLLLILVPRHPERFTSVFELCTQTPWQVVRRSSKTSFSAHTDIILGDSMGELLRWYAAADMAFVGGSLIPQGGHNPLEATALAVPVVSGNHIHNFADIYPLLVQAGGAVVVQDGAALQQQLQDWLAQPEKRQAAGQAGYTWLQPHRGVVRRLMQWMDEVLHAQN